MSPEQHRQLEQMARELQRKPGVCNLIMNPLTEGHWLACLLTSTKLVNETNELFTLILKTSFALQQTLCSNWRMKSGSGEMPTAVAAI